MIVSSANVFDGLHKVNMEDLTADGNFLLQKEADGARNFESSKSKLPMLTNSNARIFPNPVKGIQFRF